MPHVPHMPRPLHPQVKLDGLRGMGLHHNETFSAMPDLPGIPGSLRLVMSPLLAHRKYAGKYK